MEQIPGLFWVVPASGALSVVFALWLIVSVLRSGRGSLAMQDVNAMISEGAWAFLIRQYSTIGITSIVVAAILGVLLGSLSSEVELSRLKVTALGLGLRTAAAFLIGAFCSCLSGFIGMLVAVKSNLRCAAASHKGFGPAMVVALRGGAVSGFLIVALSLIGVMAIFFAFGGAENPATAPHLIVGFAFGASMVALFAQLGGGIFTKAADMGADLAGKVEAGIPEDDPRNAAVIADQVGDNVGDCAGRGADLFESTAAENIGAMIIGASLYAATQNLGWVFFPFIIRAFGLIASMVGIMFVRGGSEQEDPMKLINRGYYVSIGLSIIAMYATVRTMFGDLWLFGAGLVGILASVVIVFITQYYTEARFSPTRRIAEASKTGPATTIVTGLSVGFETVAPTALVIAVALLASYWLGTKMGLNVEPWLSGAYGTAVATMGMLMTCSYILAEDTFGPITDNANGINEFTGAGGNIRRITDRLDAAGNTTKALTKGYAMVSAGLAAFLLFQAYFDRVSLFQFGVEGKFTDVNLMRPEVFVCALVAVVMVFLFSALALRSVGEAASGIIDEVRRQIKENPGIMAGTARPNYARAVDITAKAALKGMIAPGSLPVLLPLVVGLVLKAIPGYNAPMGVGAFLMVGTIAAILMASFMNNGGGAWDNAKKFIEDGQLRDELGEVVKKGSFAHQAAVVGDTVGDPLKDTVGPSLHVVAKLIATVTLVLCPLWI